MIIDGYEWVSMVNGCRWLCMVTSGYLRLSIVSRWVCMVIDGYEWVSIVINGCRWLRVGTYDYLMVGLPHVTLYTMLRL